LAAFNQLEAPVPPFRYINQWTAYSQGQLYELLENKNGVKDEWMNKIIDLMDFVASDSNDNIEILMQMYNSGTRPFINGKFIDRRDPVHSETSYPLRHLGFEADNWILFGNQQQKINPSTLDDAIEYKNKLENIYSKEFVNASIKSFGFADCDYFDCNLERDWKYYYNNDERVWNRLREIKTKIDPNYMFNAALSVPPFPCKTKEKNNNKKNKNYEKYEKQTEIQSYPQNYYYILILSNIILVTILLFGCIAYLYKSINIQRRPYKSIVSQQFDEEIDEQ